MSPYHTTESGTLYHGDCLEAMAALPDRCVDAVITDPPYGTTACKWDTVIPFEPMWEQLKRLVKKNGAIVLFGSEPFSSLLRYSNLKMYKYDWVWEKTKAGNFIQAKNCPLKLHENISIFSQGVVIHKGQSIKRMNYNPQGVIDVDKKWSRPKVYNSAHNFKRPSHLTDRKIKEENFPSSILKFGSAHNPPHPTQKPVALIEYLIRTYTDEGETVLDFTIGSGTTAIAAKRTNRRWVGIEKEEGYCDITVKRLQAEQPGLFDKRAVA